MILWIREQIDEAKRGSKVPCECDNCNIIFNKHISDIIVKIKRSNNFTIYCSVQCSNNSRFQRTQEHCAQCKKAFELKKVDKDRSANGNYFCCRACYNAFPRMPDSNKSRLIRGDMFVNCGQCNKEIIIVCSRHKKSKSGFSFCSRSCSSIYAQAHKVSGQVRSKLEIHFSKQLNLKYPDLNIIYNNKTIIGYELDIYIPELKFAIELNGAYHYHAVNGNEVLLKIQLTDADKVIKCSSKNIDLLVIDITALGIFGARRSQIYLDKIIDKIDSKLSKKDIKFEYTLENWMSNISYYW